MIKHNDISVRVVHLTFSFLGEQMMKVSYNWCYKLNYSMVSGVSRKNDLLMQLVEILWDNSL